MSEAEIKIEALFERRVFGELVEAAEARDSRESTPTATQLVRLVTGGMSGSYLRRLSDGIPRRIIADTLGAEMSNFSKLYQRNLSKIQTDEMNDLTLFWQELRSFFDGDEELMSEWLEATIPAMSGARPVNLVSTIIGRQTLRRALDSMRYGEFA